VFEASQAELDIRLDSLRLELEIARLWAQASAWIHDEAAAAPTRGTP
jgi:hypothetical protein